jgi:hypothetical protein
MATSDFSFAHASFLQPIRFGLSLLIAQHELAILSVGAVTPDSPFLQTLQGYCAVAVPHRV